METNALRSLPRKYSIKYGSVQALLQFAVNDTRETRAKEEIPNPLD